MAKKEEKAKVGRPKLADNETKKKAITYLALSFVLLMVFAIGATFSLFSVFSANNLKGAIKSSSSGCTIYASNINTTYADMYWSCTGNVYVKHFTTYYSNKQGAAGKKVAKHNISTFPYGSGWREDKLISDRYFLFSAKLSDGNVINKLFKTPAKGTLPGDTKPTSYINITNITTNSAKATYHLQGCGNKDKKVYLQVYKNSKWTNVKGYSSEGYNKTISFSGLSAKTKYRVYIKTYNKANPNGSLYKEFTTNTPSTTTKKTTTKKTTTKKTTTLKDSYKYFTVKFNANGGKGNMPDQSIMHGDYNNNSKTKLRKNQFKKSHHSFIGWYAKRSADGKIYGYNSKDKLSWYSKNEIKRYYIYKDEQGVSRTVAPKAYVTMYAQWTYNAASSSEIVLNCPSSATVDQHFKCTTNMAGVEIKASSKFLDKSYKSSFITTKNDVAKDLEYEAPGTIKVVASKPNYTTTTRTVRINGKYYKRYSNGFIYYSQKDYEKYTYNSGVPNDNIAKSGCATTSMAMVLASLLKDESITPVVTTNEACSQKYCHSYGTDSKYFGYAAEKRKIKYRLFTNTYTQMTKKNLSKVATTLKDGGLAILAVNKDSPFTNGGHFIVIRELNLKSYDSKKPLDSYVYVADPNHPEFTNPYKLGDFKSNNWVTGIYLFNTKDIK